MTKTILITGATDGIGLLTAQTLAAEGHTILLHGRSEKKLEAAAQAVGGKTEKYLADLSNMSDVNALAHAIRAKHSHIDVVVNNAGILKAPDTVTKDGHDIRFMVNTIAPYALTQSLLPIIAKEGRVVNLSSAAQAPVDLEALSGRKKLNDMEAYAQSKLAITIWSRELAKQLPDGPAIIAVNPGSLLASKMVKEGFGVAGNDLNIGANILREAALGETFAKASGKYFDNDSGQFAQPHAAALDPDHSAAVMQGIKDALNQLR
ncbi:putative oxidoreductase [Sulfitobacter noctilucicola]|uniref:NAD(P)-dependent dehydrogenase (Short-subunit alcohol dehydrogenase family) n=1 Tax=Sulfitobacter noctilucicola TaxID=1342301 RepID=A0A7W6M7Z0_9RHOB|nr:SDR family NAD(P)-dependent oxidoreductase [Sulfitobacter noctilucicola]KIN62170.1 putative oxidoreductase [Sulfitobacter noctilucicola]MBB4173312.1 NAD(P)-dependent dehydrogenase (short-subunit alcohol dehydrogenase family) [Sulfitobacter noctilucicola]